MDIIETQIFHKNGGFKDPIMPIYRGLKKWTTKKYELRDWESMEKVKLNKLTNLIQERKAQG